MLTCAPGCSKFQKTWIFGWWAMALVCISGTAHYLLMICYLSNGSKYCPYQFIFYTIFIAIYSQTKLWQPLSLKTWPGTSRNKRYDMRITLYVTKHFLDITFYCIVQWFLDNFRFKRSYLWISCLFKGILLLFLEGWYHWQVKSKYALVYVIWDHRDRWSRRQVLWWRGSHIWWGYWGWGGNRHL